MSMAISAPVLPTPALQMNDTIIVVPENCEGFSYHTVLIRQILQKFPNLNTY